MSDKIKPKDFVEIEFIGRTDGEVFDTNIPAEARKVNPEAKVAPIVVSTGQEMLVKGFDKALEGKEIGKKYTITIKPEEAYGNRDPKLIKMIPKKVFLEHEMNPVAGMTVSLDNAIAKIISASGGRIMVDFNNPLAGKELEFEFTITKKVIDKKEQVKALQTFLFRKEFEFDLDEKRKMIVFKEPQLTPILNAFKDKFKDLIGYDVEIFSKPEKAEKPEKKPEKN